MEDGGNNFRKTICEVADGVLGNKRLGAQVGIFLKSLIKCLVESRMGLYKEYLSIRSYENKRECKERGESIKYELRRCDVGTHGYHG